MDTTRRGLLTTGAAGALLLTGAGLAGRAAAAGAHP